MFSFSLLKYGILFAHNITISSSMLFILFLNGQYFHYFSISEGTIFPSHNSILHTSLLALEKAMTPHSSTLTWKIPLTEEPGRLQYMGSLWVRHDWVTSRSLFTFMHWRRKWQPTPVFLPGESQGRGSLVGCRLWGRTVRHDWSNLAAAVGKKSLEVILKD